MHVLLLEVIALVGATVHTMEPAKPPLEGATVLMEDGVISEIGTGLEIPEGAETVDLTGLHLIPGLIDASVTFDAEHDPLYLSAGVTTVRDAGSPIGVMLPEATLGMRDRQPGPGLMVASPVFSSAMTATRQDAFILDEPIKAAQQINEVVELLGKANSRVDYFTFERGIQKPQHGVVVGAGKVYGVESWGPLPEALSLVEAQTAGQTNLAGLDSLLKGGARFETIESDEAFSDWLGSQLAALTQGGWKVEPFLMGTSRILRTAFAEGEPPALAALGGLYATAWRTDMETFRLLKAGNALEPVKLSLNRQRAMVKAIYDAGLQLVPASGAPSGGIAPGTGLVDELQEWAEAGLPAPAILELATVGAAEALGAASTLGKIAPGFTANMIACGSDPRRTVDALRSPEVVVLRGRVLERFHLDDAVTNLKERQRRIEEQRSRPIALERPPMPEGEPLVEGTANLMAYGSRSAVERYSVVRQADGTMVYGARVRVLPTGKAAGRELLIVQTIKDGLVSEFDLTLVALDAGGKPILTDAGDPAFAAKGRSLSVTKKLTIERFRAGRQIDSQGADEAIAAIDGSTALLGLIGAKHFPDGPSFVAAFDGVAMEPLVDRITMAVSADDGRLSMNDTRGARVYGFGPGGELRFAARAQAGGRLDLEPGKALGDQALYQLELKEERLFTGDAATWFQLPGSDGQAVEASGKKAEDPGK
jgi:hypothetical protein